MTDGQLLEFSSATKRFGALTAVDDLTARIAPGAVTGFLGPNGAGKTTSLRMLLGQVRPTSGSATIGGVSYSDLKHPLRTVGYVLEEASMRPRRTAIRHLTVAAKSNGIPLSRVGEVINLVGLQNETEGRIGAFSLGMRQRLSVATALLGDPGALVLDEPANGLDPEGIRWMRLLMRRLADEGRTVLVSSHVLSEIEQIADDVLVLAKGSLVYAGSISTLSDPTSGSVIVDADDRTALANALSEAGLRYDVLRSGLTVHDVSANQIGALAVTAGIPLTALVQRGPSLEEVFLDLVHGRRESVVAAPAPVVEPEVAAPETSVFPETQAFPETETSPEAPSADDEPDKGVDDAETSILPVAASAASAPPVTDAGTLLGGGLAAGAAAGAFGAGAGVVDAGVAEATDESAEDDAPAAEQPAAEEHAVEADSPAEEAAGDGEPGDEDTRDDVTAFDTVTEDAATDDAVVDDTVTDATPAEDAVGPDAEAVEDLAAQEPVDLDAESVATDEPDAAASADASDAVSEAAEAPVAETDDETFTAEDEAEPITRAMPVADDEAAAQPLPNATEAVTLPAADVAAPSFEELLRGARAFIEQTETPGEDDANLAEIFTRPETAPEANGDVAAEPAADADDDTSMAEEDAPADEEQVAPSADLPAGPIAIVPGLSQPAEHSDPMDGPEPPTTTTEITGIEIFSPLADGQTQEIQVVLDQPVEDADDHDDVTADEVPQTASVTASLAAAARAYYEDEAPSYTPGEAKAAAEDEAAPAAGEGDEDPSDDRNA